MIRTFKMSCKPWLSQLDSFKNYFMAGETPAPLMFCNKNVDIGLTIIFYRGSQMLQLLG